MKKTRLNLMESTLERIARILSDRYGVNVVMSGDRAFTDGTTIYLPALPKVVEGMSDEKVSELKRLEKAIEGYLDHEVAHVMETDWIPIKKCKEKPKLKIWVNLVEDVRIEAFISKVYMGTKINLAIADDYILSKYRKNWDDLSLAKKGVLACFSIAKNREEETLDQFPEQREELSEIISSLSYLAPYLKLSYKTKDTFDAVALATFIHAKTEGRTIDETDVPEELSGLPFTDDELGVITEKVEGMIKIFKENGFEESKDNQFDISPEEASKLEEDFAGKEKEDLLSEGASDFKIHDLGNETNYYMPFTTEGDMFYIEEMGSRSWFRRTQKEVKKSTSVMTRKLRRRLLSQSKTYWSYDHEDGELNSLALPRFLFTGDPRVFKQKSIDRTVHSRIALLIDRSVSMDLAKMKEAKKCAIMFGDFCENMKIPFEILGFSTTGTHVDKQRYKNANIKDKKKYSRWGDLSISIFKEFHENWRRVGPRIERMKSQIHNIDGESIEIASRRLISSSKPGERLILFVFSDGMPLQEIEECQPIQQWYLTDVIKRVKKSGIELIGVGIQTDHVKHYYPDWFSIDDPSNLSHSQIEKMSELLITHRK